MGTDYKKLLYAKLNHSNSSSGTWYPSYCIIPKILNLDSGSILVSSGGFTCKSRLISIIIFVLLSFYKPGYAPYSRHSDSAPCVLLRLVIMISTSPARSMSCCQPHSALESESSNTMGQESAMCCLVSGLYSILSSGTHFFTCQWVNVNTECLYYCLASPHRISPPG